MGRRGERGVEGGGGLAVRQGRPGQRPGERAVELLERVLAGSEDRLGPDGAAGQDAARERRQQPRPERGGLAAARVADEPQERAAHEAGDQLGDQALPAEVVVRVRGLELGQALVRADRPQPGGHARAVELVGIDRIPPHPFPGPRKVGHVADEGCFGLAQPAPAGLGPLGRGPQAPGGTRPGPAARHPVDGGRHPARLAEQVLDRGRLDSPAGIEGDDAPHRVDVDRADRPALLGRGQALGQGDERRRGLAAVDDEGHRGSPGDRRGPPGEGGDRVGGRGIEIVDDREDRAAGRGGEDALIPVREAVAEADRRHEDDGRAVVVRNGRELRGETGPADAGDPGQDHVPAVAVARPTPVPPQPAQLRLAAGDRDERVELGWQGRRR